MKFHKNDVIFFSVSLILLSVTLGALYLDYTRVVRRNITEQIGVIIFKQEVPERKYTAQSLWDGLKNNSPIYNHDTIRTSDKATALVKLHDGSEVDLSPNSLVVLSVEDALTNVAVGAGNISAKSSGGSLRLVSDQVQALLQDGEVNFSKDEDGNLMVVSDAIDFSLLSEGEQIELGENKVVEISKDGKPKVKEVSYVLQNPKNSDSFVTHKSQKNIDFSWQANDDASKTLLISTNPNFKRTQHQVKTKQNSVTLAVQSGIYFWKVKGEGESKYQKFQLFQDKLPKLLFPQNNETFRYISNKPLIKFGWQQSELTGVYKIQIFRDAKGSNQVLELTSRSHSIAIDSLTEGTYYWRVKNIYPNNFKADEIVSSMRKFVITKQKELDRPKIIQEKEKAVLTQKMLSQESPSFFWQEDKNADHYKVEIALDKDFNNVVHVAQTEYNFLRSPKSLKEGEYYWRVTAVSQEKESQASKEEIIIVKKIGDIYNIYPEEKASFFAHENFPFLWEDENRESSFAVKISKTQNFEKIEETLQSTISRASASKKFMPGSNYFWQVEAFDKNGKLITKGPVSSFRIKGLDGVLELVSPQPNQTIDFAYANGIVFSWKRASDAQFYQFKIFYESEGKEKILYDEILTGNSFQTNNLTRYRERDYFWGVTAMVKDKEGNYVNISETEKRKFTVVLSKKIRAPKLTAPEGLTVYEK